MDIPFDLSDITSPSDNNGISADVYDNFTWKGLEATIIVLSFIAILVNIAVFFSLKMHRVCSSSMLIFLMTLILGIRVATEGLKILDD